MKQTKLNHSQKIEDLDIHIEDLDTIAVGRTSEIFLWSPTQVLKLFFANIAYSDIECEYNNLMKVNNLGVHSVACHRMIKIGDRSGIILELIKGDSLVKKSMRSLKSAFTMPREFAQLQASIHKKSNDSLDCFIEQTKNMLHEPPMDFLSQEQQKKAKALLDKLPRGSAILHLDYHPENVIAQDEQYVVIDWMTAAKGHPAADVAATRFIFLEAELWPGTPLLKRLLLNSVRKIIFKFYIQHYKKITGIKQEEIDRFRLPSLIARLGRFDVASEHTKIKRQIRALLD